MVSSCSQLLLLREVKILRESEANMQQEISILKELLAVRGEIKDSASSSDDAGSDQPVNVMISEPVASQLGVDGLHRPE